MPLTRDVIISRMDDALAEAKRSGLDGASVSCNLETGFSVSVRDGGVESVEHHQAMGLSIHVHKGEKSGSCFTTDLTAKSIVDSVQTAKSLANIVEADPAGGLPDQKQLACNAPNLLLHYPWEYSPTEAIEDAVKLEAQARGKDKRIVLSDGVTISSYASEHFLQNTLGFCESYQSTSHSKSISLVAREGSHNESDFEYTQARRATDLWSDEKLAESVARKVVARLGARQLTTRSCPVVFSPSMAKGLLSHFVSAISGSSLYQRASFLLDSCGQKLFPSNVQIDQSPHIPCAMGSAPFDADGVSTRAYDLVRDGILQQYVLGTYGARRLGLETTGNAGGVYNLMLKATDGDQASILQKMGTGLLVTDLMGQGVNIATGTYSRGAFGYWVENGIIQYPVEEITIAGNLKDMFAGISAIGSDADRRGRIHTGSILIDNMVIAGG